MKKGLVSPPQPARSNVACLESGVNAPGEEIGPLIVQVEEPENIFEVGSPYYWVDVPDETIAYAWYYDTSSSTAITLDPATYYATSSIEDLLAEFGDTILLSPPTLPPIPNTTPLVPPVPNPGQTLQWSGSAWVVASFDITLSLPAAKNFLIQTVTVNGAAAVNNEVELYSTVQQIEAPSVTALETKDYPGTTIGEYQTYVDGLVTSSVATINAAATVEDLYSFNPAEVPFTPAAEGVIFTGRGSGLGPLDMNVSYYTGWNSTTVLESDTELYVPGTDTVIAYGSGGPGQFDSMGNCFTTGDYRVQIRQASTGFVLAEYECPLSPSGEEVNF